MSHHVLIAYGSKHGSTADTAERIGELLREHGLEVDVSEAGRVKSLDDYDSVIVGGSIYMGRWHPDAHSFTKRFATELAERQVAYFAMGPKSSSDDDLGSAREQLARYKLEPLTVFGGVIDPSKLHFPFSRMPATDARDWDAIREFAADYARGQALAAR